MSLLVHVLPAGYWIMKLGGNVLQRRDMKDVRFRESDDCGMTC